MSGNFVQGIRAVYGMPLNAVRADGFTVGTTNVNLVLGTASAKYKLIIFCAPAGNTAPIYLRNTTTAIPSGICLNPGDTIEIRSTNSTWWAQSTAAAQTLTSQAFN